MSSKYQNRLQDAISGLSAQQKFRSLVERQVETKMFDPLIIKSITDNDRPLIQKFLQQYLNLPYLYYEKLWLRDRLIIYDTRESWREQVNITLMSLNFASSIVEALDKFNTTETKYGEVTNFCYKRRKELKKLINLNQRTQKGIDNLIVRKPEFQNAFNNNEEQINIIEANLGFKYPYRDSFN